MSHFTNKLLLLMGLAVSIATEAQTRFTYQGNTLTTNEHRLLVGSKPTNARRNTFRTIEEALRAAEHKSSTDTTWTEIYIEPSVYWIDNPDDKAIRVPRKGENTPYGCEVNINRVHMIGMSDKAEDVVLACNRGQTQGADGNFTMFHFIGSDFKADNITFGNYCNVDLEYPRNPKLNRAKRRNAIVQAQLAICQGDRYTLTNCRFISRLNLCPFVGAPHTNFERCYFECTDDALCGTGIYRQCRFTLFSSKPFYTTDGIQGATFIDCDLHSKTKGTQYLTKASGPVSMTNCRWTSDDPTLTIEWTKRPDPRHRCVMTGCTLNGKPLNVPQPTAALPISLPPFAIGPQTAIISGQWTLDCYKPLDTMDRDWTADNTRSSWGYAEGIDGAEGCWGLMQLQKGARMMYTPAEGQDSVGNQRCHLVVVPCKSGGQGFGSATTQYLDICIKFDTRTLTGYGLRLQRTPDYDHSVVVSLVEYANGRVTPLTEGTRCDLFKGRCSITLQSVDRQLTATMTSSPVTPTSDSVAPQEQTLTATMPHPNHYGGFHLQHTGSTGASATVIQSILLQ